MRNSNLQRCIEDIEKVAEAHNITIKLPNTSNIVYDSSGNVKVSGYFDGEVKELACAVGKPESEWIPIFLHEACHMFQFIENCKAWSDTELDKYHESYGTMDSFFQGWYIPKGLLRRAFKAAFNCELDCEKRTVELIKQYNLEIDLEEYIQKANSYIWGYQLMYKYRQWYVDGKSPYSVEAVWKAMPKHFNVDYDNMPPEIENLYIMHCFDITKRIHKPLIVD